MVKEESPVCGAGLQNRLEAVLGYIISGCSSGSDRATHRNHTRDGDRNPGVRVRTKDRGFGIDVC